MSVRTPEKRGRALISMCGSVFSNLEVSVVFDQMSWQVWPCVSKFKNSPDLHFSVK